MNLNVSYLDGEFHTVENERKLSWGPKSIQVVARSSYLNIPDIL